MADEAAEKPAFDPHELLSKLESVVNSHRSPSGGGSSWVGTLIIIAVVLAGMAVWSWISFRNNRELAKLRHEREKQRILAEKAVVDAKVTKNDETVAEASKQAAVLEQKIAHTDADIAAEEERYAANLRAIDRIRSWRDVDPSVR